jgi:hypothetical protein
MSLAFFDVRTGLGVSAQRVFAHCPAVLPCDAEGDRSGVVFEKITFPCTGSRIDCNLGDFAGGTPAATINLTRRLPPPVRHGELQVLRERAAADG